MSGIGSWSLDVPSSTSQIRHFPELYRSDKSVLQSGISTEHYFSGNSVGQHRPGSARIFTGPSSQVSTVADSGRLMLDTTTNTLFVLSSTSTVAIAGSNYIANEVFS